MEKQSLIGRRVRIINGYDDNEGQEGVVVRESTDHKDSSSYLYVELDNGQECLPYAPGTSNPQCELLPEEPTQDLSIQSDDKWYVRCISPEFGMKIGKEYVVVRGDTQSGGFMDYLVNTPNGNKWVKNIHVTRKYQKQSNTQTMSTTEQKIAQLEKELAQLKEEVANPWKVGEWYILKSVGGHIGGYKQGVAAKLTHYKVSGKEVPNTRYINKENPIYDSYIVFNNGEIVYTAKEGDVNPIERAATQEEIKNAEQYTEIIIKIGNSQLPVTVNKDGIRVDAKRPDVSDINRLIVLMNAVSGSCLPWDITVPYVKIGCCENVTIAQLQEVVNAYNKLNQ